MIVCRSQSPVFFAWFVLPLALALVGCRPGSNSSSDDATATALYGAPTGTASVSIARSAKLSAGAENWETNDFFVLSTELSPATLVHSKTPHLTVFGGMTNAGLGAPRYVAWPTREGPRTFNRGDKLDVSVMTEGWVLVWWSGAQGWTNWDCPWALFLQHKPDAMSLDDDGLHLDFPKQAGDVVMMPLYGYEKLALENFDFRATNRLAEPKVKVKTWEWPTVITRDPLTRIRYWIAATRDFPIHCGESFSVDREQGTVVVRSKFHRRAIVDDWKSRRVKLAPISPALALAAKDGAFPVRFSGRWFDLEVPTPFGPFLGIEGVDEYDTTFATLRYVNAMETISTTDPGTNSVGTATRAALRQLAARPPAGPQTARDAFRFALALPHLDGTTRSNLIPALQTFLGERIAGSGGIVDPNLIPAAWAYSHYNGDWEWIRRHWAKLKQMFMVPATMTWAGAGRTGDGATLCLAFARMAYKVGDMDGYHYGCLAFTRELAALAAGQRSGEYVRKHQPWHSMTVIPESAMVTGNEYNARGWQFGEGNPMGATAASTTPRWNEFFDFDVARFCRDYLKADLRKEFAGALVPSGDPGRLDASSRSSIVQLRSLLFNEGPAEPDTATRLAAGTGAGPIAECLAILRATQPIEVQNLIPAGTASAFVTGLEREDSAGNSALLVAFSRSYSIHEEAMASWPELTWPNWSTPTGARWTFGQIRPVRDAKAPPAKHLPINWNSVIHGNAVP